MHNLTGDEIKEVEHAKYLGLSRNGSSRKDVTERLAKARKHFNTFYHFGGTQGFRIYNAVFVPMLVYGMESAALTQADLHSLESFHSKALRKMHRIPATLYTKVLDPSHPTTSNNQLRRQTSQPPLRHYIHRAQFKLLDHIPEHRLSV